MQEEVEQKTFNIVVSTTKLTARTILNAGKAAVTSRISKKPNQPTHVLIDKNPAFSRPSVVLLEQIFTIDKERINNFMGLTSEWEMKQIEEALLKSLGINK